MAEIESWYWIDREQQRLMLHVENDSYRAMRHGLEPCDTPVDIDRMGLCELRRALQQILKRSWALL